MNTVKLVRTTIAALALTAVAWAQPAPPATPPTAPRPVPAPAPRAKNVKHRVVVRDGRVWRSENGGPLVLEDLLGRGYLGVHLVDLTPELRTHFRADKEAGVMVGSVVGGSPAEEAGLKVGDVITEVNDQKIETAWDLSHAIRGKKAGQSVKVEYIRNGARQQAFAKVEERKRTLVQIPPIPPIDIDIDTDAMKEIGEYFNSPEWKAKVEKMSDCGRMQERLQELESRMKELEKKLK